MRPTLFGRFARRLNGNISSRKGRMFLQPSIEAVFHKVEEVANDSLLLDYRKSEKIYN